MAYDPSIFNINPYYDDFDGDKGFLRVLFKPGYAVQARELTQLQSILQDQFSKIGDHLFKDGSRIVGGGISVRNSSYAMLSVESGSPLNGLDDYSFMVGGILRTSSGNTKAKIVHYIVPDTTDGNLIVVLDFISGDSLDANVLVFEKENFDSISGITLRSGVSYPTEGTCKLVSVSDGIFYVDGFFVRVSNTQFSPYRVVDSYRDLSFNGFGDLSKRIGFTINRDSITDSEDPTLRDPSVGSYNYNAPGADRYKIILELAQTDIDVDTVDFIELLRFESGKITKKIDKISYGEIQKALARRTFDESGSYTVNPFDIVAKPFSNDTLSLSVGKGKAYVLGYEVENQYPASVSLPKARTLQTESDVRFLYTVGNYVTATVSNSGGMGQTFANYLSSTGSGSSRVVLRTGGGSLVGEGYVHGIIPHPTFDAAAGKTGPQYRFYLYGLSGSMSQLAVQPGFGYLYDNTNGYTIGNLTDILSSADYTNDTGLVFEIKPGYAVSSVQDMSVPAKIIGDISTPVSVTNSGTSTTYTFSKSHFAGTIAAANNSVYSFFPYGQAGYNSVDASEISFIRSSDGAAFTPASGTLSNNNETVSLTVTNAPAGFTSSGVLRAVAPIVYTPNLSDATTIRTKTPTTTTVNITSTSTITDENGRVYFDLQYADVYSVSAVSYTTGTPATTVSVTEDFELDDGQRDTHYQNARLYIKPDKAALARYTSVASAVTLQVSLSYYTHGGLASAPFVGAASYVGVNYESIPLYTNSKTGKSVSLANCLDFRRSGLTSSVQMIKPYGRSEFGILGDTVVSYDHYLPRVDKLCVKADPEDGSALFFLVSGTPDLAPVAAPDPIDALVLATITVPAYTHSKDSIVITPVDSKRYTMADIGRVEKRVDEVEVFAKLSLSESELEARSLKTSGADTTEPLKTSIFVDEFYGHSVGDVVDSSYSCSIDYERGEMRPFFSVTNVTTPTPTLINTVRSADGIATLQFSEQEYISNKQYTGSVSVNPSNTVNWLGYMSLDVSVDPFYDQSYRPVVKTNALSENDNWLSCNADDARGFGTQWNEWESNWTGIETIQEEQDDIQKKIVELPRSVSASAIPSVNSGSNVVGISRVADSVNKKTSNYIRVRQLKNRIKKTIGSRVVDRSVVPYIPSRTVTATVTGLKPNTGNLKLLFDGQVLVSGFATDEFGSCSVSFTIPAGTFLVGERVVRVSDSEITANCTMAAEAVYYCTGLLEQRDSGSYSTRPPVLRRQLPTSETVSKDPFNRDIDSVENTHWSDPLTQTFFVDKKSNPNGIFLSSVSLYFAGKDEVLPVAIQIRPTVSGYPSPSVVLPFSTVVKASADVVASSTLPTETKFTFSSPVYLEPGEYAICVLANSDNYRLFAAESGINGVANADAVAGRAGNNQRVGTLYGPQGIGPATEINNTDLMFAINRCEFVSSGTIRWDDLPFTNSNQIAKVYASEIIPEPCTISRQLDSYVFPNNESVYFRSAVTTPDLVYQMVRGSDTSVSPVVDLGSILVAAVSMNSASPATSTARYVSRVVELPEDLHSNGIAVFVDANIPVSSADSVRVYYRPLLTGENDIFSKTWVEMTRLTSQFTSSSEIDFREVEFRGETSMTSKKFGAYQIAVELTSPSTTSTYYATPSARNIRTVSYIRP